MLYRGHGRFGSYERCAYLNNPLDFAVIAIYSNAVYLTSYQPCVFDDREYHTTYPKYHHIVDALDDSETVKDAGFEEKGHQRRRRLLRLARLDNWEDWSSEDGPKVSQPSPPGLLVCRQTFLISAGPSVVVRNSLPANKHGTTSRHKSGC